ncbi:hypothetical protein V5799_006136 [Amblyomma americanum]|uniref:Uncharacterized protein n=1 Tax=Amblyomma americanum TaxID=6943 RepID=A0AAQ4DX95_AMBAM
MTDDSFRPPHNARGGGVNCCPGSGSSGTDLTLASFSCSSRICTDFQAQRKVLVQGLHEAPALTQLSISCVALLKKQTTKA